jgi:hypothetical protein
MIVVQMVLLSVRLAASPPRTGEWYDQLLTTDAPTVWDTSDALEERIKRKIKSEEGRQKARKSIMQMGLLLSSSPTFHPTQMGDDKTLLSSSPTFHPSQIELDKSLQGWARSILKNKDNLDPSASPTTSPTEAPTNPTVAPTWSREDAMLMGYPTRPPTTKPSVGVDVKVLSESQEVETHHTAGLGLTILSEPNALPTPTLMQTATPTALPTIGLGLVSNDTTSVCEQLLKDGQACVICGEGTYKPSNAPSCIPCTVAKKGEVTRAVFPLWKVAHAERKSRVEVKGCSSCPPGKYSTKQAQQMCHECPRGRTSVRASSSCGELTPLEIGFTLRVNALGFGKGGRLTSAALNDYVRASLAGLLGVPLRLLDARVVTMLSVNGFEARCIGAYKCHELQCLRS